MRRGLAHPLLRCSTTRGNTMTIARFTNYIRYSTACPDGITPERWGGMLTWARTHGYLT